MKKPTVKQLEGRIKDLEAANSRLASDRARMALTMREAVHNGNEWREKFWLVLKLVDAYVQRVPDLSKGDPVAQAKMIASIDPENKKWSIFWDSPTDNG